LPSSHWKQPGDYHMNILSGLKRRFFIVILAVLAFVVVACGPTAPGNDAGTAGGGASGSNGELSARITGAGASFPAPLYQRWFNEFNRIHPGAQINYQSVGSGAGIERFLANTVDFGATDAPLNESQRQQFVDQFGEQPIQVPMVAGTVVFAYNLDGVEELKLSREAFCGIVTGNITRWNDPAIASVNEGVTLPDQRIQWVHRSDGSGTNFLFTNHINAACPNWPAGAGTAVEWPTGTGARGNEGITAQVQQTPGAIGFVEFAFARENGLSVATLENAAGNFIQPAPEAAALVFKDAEVPEDFALVVPDPQNPDAYPIAGLTWMLFYPKYPANKVEVINAMVEWALTDGETFALDLGYVPLEVDIANRVKETVSTKVLPE
jgi:phosphate transport system substrate-binding protein